jgi:hypothetical protein
MKAGRTIQFDVSKQIGFVGLERTGSSWYRCRYPLVLAAWLRQQGYAEKPVATGEIARLVGSQAEVRVRDTGSVHILGAEPAEAHNVLRRLLKR